MEHLDLEEVEISIGDLFEFLEIDNNKYNETQITNTEIYIKTDVGALTPIKGYVKKQSKSIYECAFENGESVKVADTHIFRTNGKEIFAKDSENIMLDTLNDPIKCTNVECLSNEDVYDISIESPHWYAHNDEFANGVISHNTFTMASFASQAALDGHSVAIFSFEDGEIAWSSRIDANLLDMTLDEMKERGPALKSTFDSVIGNNIKIKLKEYPTGSATVNQIKSVLKEWYLKEQFQPDIIFVDYIGIMGATKKVQNGYEKGKAVAEELRSLAVEMNCAVVSAVQIGRQGYNSTTIGMEDTADSIGIPQTADLMVGIVAGGEENPDKYFLSILKSRSIDKRNLSAIAVDADVDHQRLSEIDDGRKARVPKKIKETLETMQEIVDIAEAEDVEAKIIASPKKNDDLDFEDFFN